MLGLTLALRMRGLGQDVTGDVVWDKFYHVILESDVHVHASLAELDLTEKVRRDKTRTGFYTDGVLHSMSDTVDFLKLPPLRLVDKVRLSSTIFLTSRIKDGRRLEDRTVESYLMRLSGHRTFEKIWLPLLRAKLGSNSTNANETLIWVTRSRMCAARRSGLKTEGFCSVTGGYETVLTRLEERVTTAVEPLLPWDDLRVPPPAIQARGLLCDQPHRRLGARHRRR